MARKSKNNANISKSQVVQKPSPVQRAAKVKQELALQKRASLPVPKPAPKHFSIPPGIAVPAALAVAGSVLGKKKKKKRGILGKIGGFLSGALEHVLQIAPNIVHSLANNVHEDWQQGGHTKASLKQLALKTDPVPFMIATPRGGAVGKRWVVSKETLQRSPYLKETAKRLGTKLVALPNNMMSAPVTYGAHSRYFFKTSSDTHRKFGAGLRIVGTDYVTDVTITDAVQGHTFKSLDLNPARWDFTRIQKYAAMYERFIINSVAVMYTPNCPTSTTGSLISWFDYDPTDTNGEGRDAVVRARASIGQDNSPVWAAHICHFKRDPEQPDYYVESDGSDDRLTSAGTYYLTALAGCDTDFAGTAGTISIIYDISFFVPSVQQETPGPSPEYLITAATATSANMDGANPLGDTPTVDVDVSIGLVKEEGSSTVYGFSGTSTIPSKYLYILHATGTGITATTRTLGEGMSAVFNTGIANAGGTASLHFGVVQVEVAPDQNPEGATFNWTLTCTTVTGSSMRFFRVSSGLGLNNLGLQSYEKMTIGHDVRIETLEKQIQFLVGQGKIPVMTGLKKYMKGGDSGDGFGNDDAPLEPIGSVPTDPVVDKSQLTPLQVKYTALPTIGGDEKDPIDDFVAVTRVRNQCIFCKEMVPDHDGRDCPKNPKVIEKRNKRNKVLGFLKKELEALKEENDFELDVLLAKMATLDKP